MYIDFDTKSEEELLEYLSKNILSKSQRKIVVKKLNDDFGLIDAIVYVPTDFHPHYVKSIKDTTNLGLNLLYGEKKPSQNNKRVYYWIDYHGKFRKSYHKGGRPKIFVDISNIDRIAGKRVKKPVNPLDYEEKNS